MKNTMMIRYEHPQSEISRLCLRLEQLFNKIDDQLKQTAQAPWQSVVTLRDIVHTLEVIDRFDIKTKFTTALTQQRQYLLKQLSNNEEDLSATLAQLSELNQQFYKTQGRMAQSLQENEFLRTMRHHASRPGGMFNFDLPALQLWQHQPVTQRQQDLATWLQELSLLKEASLLLLSLIRKRTMATTSIATNGFYQHALNPQIVTELISIEVDPHLNVFPEISAGRHRFSLHFYRPNFYGERPQRIQQDISFCFYIQAESLAHQLNS